MKKTAIVFCTLFAFVACKEDKKDSVINDNTDKKENILIQEDRKVAQILSEVINAHGGMVQWDKMNNLCFSFEGRAGEETHTISLKNRNEKIEHEQWSIGNAGQGVWLFENEPESYKGNALFYNNLMFYFYAMPFVLADDGIVYTPMPAQELDGKMHNAVKIGYEDAVGYSPKDEYMLFTDPETNKMTWLGYTVTGSSNTKSDKWSFIKYGKWQEVNGLQLPEKLTWYNVANNLPISERNDLRFNNVTITETVIPASVFAMPAGAVVVTD